MAIPVCTDKFNCSSCFFTKLEVLRSLNPVSGIPYTDLAAAIKPSLDSSIDRITMARNSSKLETTISIIPRKYR